MNDLFTAIYSRFAAEPHNTLYTAVGDRMYLKKAPQNVVFPYVVFNLVVDIDDWNFTHEYNETTVQFSMFSQNSSASEAGTILGYLNDLYDHCSLSVAGGRTAIYMQPEQTIQNDSIETDPPIYGYVKQYEILLQA